MTTDNTQSFTNENELQQIISQWQSFNNEKKEFAERFKEFKANVKSSGYDAKIIGMIIKEMQRTQDSIAEEEALLETYKREAGLLPD